MSNNNFVLNYLCCPNKTKGRYFVEEEDKYRSCFQRDRDRIIHSNAFRKLEYKTQVFINYAHDYYRTRLTHSLEVAQIARSITCRLKLNEDITECIALAHDLGHTPFGHAGEDALNQSLKLVNQECEFDHNIQTLRILVFLEQKHADFDGLNLSWEVIEGIAKHNGPSITNNKLLIEYNNKYDLKLNEFPSAEAQVASIADDIAYSIHDLDDALRASFITIEDLLDVPLVGDTFQSIKHQYPNISKSKIIHESLSKIISVMINDVVCQTEQNIQAHQIKSIEDIRRLNKPLVTFSPTVARHIVEMKKFNMAKIYTHYKISRTMNKAKRIISDLFLAFYNNPELLPDEWSNIGQDPRVICDYISGMTDRFAIHEHRRIFDTSYEMTRF